MRKIEHWHIVSSFFDLGQWSRSVERNFLPMNQPDERGPVRKTPKAKPSRVAETRRAIGEYANDLWEIIKRLRMQLH
ncbi:hypothetical protein MA20_32705 [Bradyrhizobium japonicum]|uniref:Uncharacterized protein n=2 Tax=Bradyrhizobium TaxID=374 RepID=A0A0A3YNL1_BRAJP|nr:hypothetical protein RN69_15185 [Bradyrhizobium japonicum]KGT75278.1 hypothetical protein MA20_32705 [Bradyrhizobium japonicum]QOZ71155.1 hypothetical protein WN72_36315 [Bradyrhizobium arachidis]